LLYPPPDVERADSHDNLLNALPAGWERKERRDFFV
jgi:hypothetical protein